MYSLFCEAKFWTSRNDMHIRDTDFGAFSYRDKKDIVDCPYQEGKKTYCEKRGATVVLSNKRPIKLKDALRDLENYLLSHKIVFHSWKSDSILQLLLNIGVIVNIGINIHNGDIGKITFDKYLVGKLLSENISDVVSTKTHLIISYNENQLTLVNYGRPLTTLSTPEKLSRLDPKIQQVELSGPSGRRLERKLSANVVGDMILTWWHSTRNEVYPWSPLVKDKDRANVHIYSLVGNKLELLCYYRTEFDQICVNFSQIKNNCIWLVEQKVSKKGDVTVEYSSYEIVKSALQKLSITSIPLQTQVCCYSLSPDEEKLILGCIDGSLVLFDESKGITRIVKTAFIPNLVSWHNDGGLIVVANERSQFQCFDIALSCLRAQLLSEDLTPSNLIDLGSYFKIQPTLVNMGWKEKAAASFYTDKYIPNDNFLLLIFEGGPIGILSLIGGGGLVYDYQKNGLTSDVIIRQYLLWNQVDKAINLLLSLNWNTNGPSCLAGLYHITNFILRYPLTLEKEYQLETALGSFHMPLQPLDRVTENEYGDQVHDLTRRFFHQLLRYQLYEKAYRLAIDLNDSDLFIDFYHCAKALHNDEMANAAQTKFAEIVCRSENSSNSSHSLCSCSSLEDFTSSSTEVSNLPPLPQVSVKKLKNPKIPPLPDLDRQTKCRESAFFVRNSVYLHNEAINTIPEERPSEMSNSFESVTASTAFNDIYSWQDNVVPDFCLLNSDVIKSSAPSDIIRSDHHYAYETSTSFCDDLNLRKLKPREEKAGTSKNAINVIEKLYDLPTEPRNKKIYRDDLCNRPAALDKYDTSNVKANKLLSQQFKTKSMDDQKCSSIVDLPKNFLSTKRLPFFDNPARPTSTVSGGKRILLKSTLVKPSAGLNVPKNFSKPVIQMFPENKYSNNTGHLKSLPGVSLFSSQISKQCLKTSAANASPTKQKVKFSDTVTQIMVPDISNMSIDDEPVTLEDKGCCGSGISAEVEAQYGGLPVGVENDNYLRTLTGLQDRHRANDESEGTIKVIHFGVV